MTEAILRMIVAKLIPALAGAIGAFLLLNYPALHASFCTGVGL